MSLKIYLIFFSTAIGVDANIHSSKPADSFHCINHHLPEEYYNHIKPPVASSTHLLQIHGGHPLLVPIPFLF
jgi:hypothetical protein